MFTNLLFDLQERQTGLTRPGLWLFVALFLTVGHLVFAMILIGIQGLSRGGAMFAVMSMTWVVIGLISKQIRFPPILILPVLFYFFAVLSGFNLAPYPSEYIGQMTTIWLGGIALAVFVANGISINVIVGGFVLLFIANMAAIAMGYDGHLINYEGYDTTSLQSVKIRRYSGLAGQSNLLVSQLITLPFLLFLLKRKPGFIVYLLVIAAAVATTILSGSRSAILFSALLAVTGAIWLIGNSQLRTLAIVTSLVGSIAAVSFLSSDYASSRVEHSRFGHLEIVKRVLSGLDEEDNSTDTRKQFITGFWPYFNKKPFVGHGPDMFGEVTGAGTYAHNNFVEIAVNWGLIGLALYYAMYLTAFFGIVNSLAYKSAMLAPLLYLMMADNWFVTYINRAMVLCLCLLLIKIHSSVNIKRRRRRRRHHSTAKLPI